MKRGFDLANLELQQVALRTRLYSFQSRFDTRLFFFQPLIECMTFGSTPHGALLALIEGAGAQLSLKKYASRSQEENLPHEKRPARVVKSTCSLLI